MLASRILSSLAFLLATDNVLAATPIVSAVGSKFFTADGNQFYIKGMHRAHFPSLDYHMLSSLSLPGIAYQLISTDPLIDTDQCKQDAKQMQDLGANTIRVYHVDPTADHQGCMNAFADAGIYLFVDLDDFPTQIQPVPPPKD